MKKIIRVTTVPISLGGLLKGQLNFMTNHMKVIGISSNGDGKLAEVSQEEGIEVIPVEMTRKITPIKDLKAVYHLYKIFKEEKPDIVHSHTPKAGTLSMLAAKLAGVPNRLHTIAGMPLLEATGVKRSVLDFVERITYACATKIYPNSFGLYDIIVDNNYTTRDKLKVIGNGSSNGIDTSHFDPALFSLQDKEELKKSLGIDETDFIYIFVGRWVRDKGINELITAFKRINNENSDTKLLLLGRYEKELDPVLPETEKEIETNPNIINVGWQNDVRPYFSIADVLTFPSYREGFPNVVMQASAMGMSSIVTNINGCNEIISDRENGLIIPVKDADSLYNAMRELAQNQNLAQQLAIGARPRIMELYERKAVWKSLLNEYKTLLT
ncbi:glycosyltransferase family 4 protein [Aquimarina intermedia]|uniref:Glycosyltransferase involved in cell wall biosynthesis n=1 Tax=Aquimarina intermedia TaxID=350814 RepID=A0A5S5C731_9FLAO|nr:glycosyltransferase family 4 protein [Aquimarina intermedia]TYP75154.1 glycosyltransferase involved in cell wall biosynthesis [Aquimarina intermedia]